MIIGAKVFYTKAERGKIVEYSGSLVHFGIGYEEVRDGIGHYTEAVIMKDDGTIDTCPVSLMRFKV